MAQLKAKVLSAGIASDQIGRFYFLACSHQKKPSRRFDLLVEIRRVASEAANEFVGETTEGFGAEKEGRVELGTEKNEAWGAVVLEKEEGAAMEFVGGAGDEQDAEVGMVETATVVEDVEGEVVAAVAAAAVVVVVVVVG